MGDSMPTQGKSLIGFMDEAEAISYLQNFCVTADPQDINALRDMWVAARGQLGAPIANVGHPAINPIPPSHHPYIAQLLAQPWMQEAMRGPLLGSQFAMVDINSLLAFQFSVDAERSGHHCGAFDNPPNLDQLFQACLPLALSNDPVRMYPGPNSMLITSRSLNFQTTLQGFMHGAFVGMQVGYTLPLVHVVRLNGRCYLHNGFHRTYGAAIAGATAVPCVFRDVPDAMSAGIRPGTFQLPLMESADPPTLAHLIGPQAYTVQLRAFTRTIHVSWADYVTPAE